MKRLFFAIGCLLVQTVSPAQAVNEKLAKAFQKFESDSQLQAAISSLFIVDAKTGDVVFEKNSTIGLAPASTQKIITSVTAYELLGKDFRYRTEFAIDRNDNLLIITPSGDPTFGSWRWLATNEFTIMKRIVQAVNKLKVKNFSGVTLDGTGWEAETMPDGWIWQDIGNYYGAGARKLNWRENQFDVILKSGNKIGDPVQIVGTIPKLKNYRLFSFAISGVKGSGDNTNIYFSLTQPEGIIRGTIPIDENRFSVSGAMPDGTNEFLFKLFDTLQTVNIRTPRGALQTNNYQPNIGVNAKNVQVFFTHTSPPLDSIIYWFNKKSINLYGEALIKTIGHQKEKIGSTERGVELVKAFWKDKGIAPVELNILDGSGLSSSSRITTHALVEVLKYAKKQPWFNGFYNSLPEYNGMKMKSGTIKNVKGFAGYHTSKAGVEYVFAFLVNNYNGPASSLVSKIYTVLDELK